MNPFGEQYRGSVLIGALVAICFIIGMRVGADKSKIACVEKCECPHKEVAP